MYLYFNTLLMIHQSILFDKVADLHCSVTLMEFEPICFWQELFLSIYTLMVAQKSIITFLFFYFSIIQYRKQGPCNFIIFSN